MSLARLACACARGPWPTGKNSSVGNSRQAASDCQVLVAGAAVGKAGNRPPGACAGARASSLYREGGNTAFSYLGSTVWGRYPGDDLGRAPGALCGTIPMVGGVKHAWCSPYHEQGLC